MHIRGIVQTARLEENPAGSGTIEMHLSVQGVGPGQPRQLIIPHALLLADESLDADLIEGRGFAATLESEGQRWVVTQIAFASRVLRAPE